MLADNLPEPIPPSSLFCLKKVVAVKIAHLTFSFLPKIGGKEIFVHNLALHQEEAGHQVTVITTWNCWHDMKKRGPYRMLPLLPSALLLISRTRNLGYDLRWLVNAQVALYQILFNFDIWHIHMAHPIGMGTASTLRNMKVSSLLSSYGGDIQTLPEIGYGMRVDPEVEKDLLEGLPKLDRVVAISPGTRAEFLKLGVAREKLHEIPAGVNISRIEALPVDREAVRAKRGWPAHKTILLTVGRHHPVKGYRYIPEIIQVLAGVREDFLWVLAAGHSEPIAKMSAQMGVDAFLQIPLEKEKPSSPEQQYVRPTDDLIEMYKTADILVFPSLLEGMPLVLIEAMAARLPIVTTDAPGCRDAVLHEKTGLISPVRDVAGMATNILRLMEDAFLREQLAENAAKQGHFYDLKNVAARYQQLYDELCPGSATRHSTAQRLREE